MKDLQALLAESAARHSHLCPRQVLGVRAGLAGLDALGLKTPWKDKRLLVILETDGCFADGIEVATRATVGHRRLRVEDYGKIAATFVDIETEQAVRIRPCIESRQKAWQYAPGEERQYFAQLQAYQVMPAEELFDFQRVQLLQPVSRLISRPGVRTSCERCGEEIINEREIHQEGAVLCRACTGPAYYTAVSPAQSAHLPSPKLIQNPRR